MSAADWLWLGPDGAEEAASAARVGSKAAEIRRMARLGLNTPPAFALPTDLCAEVNADSDKAPGLVVKALRAGMERLERVTGLEFGDRRAPLLVSVRSGAEKSMPGMLASVLNVGLTTAAVHGLIRRSGDPRLGWDSYRRFIQSYATVVSGLPGSLFAEPLARLIATEAACDEAELDSEALERLSIEYAEIAAARGAPIPEEPIDQLTSAAVAVYRSWESPKAKAYRRLHGLEDLAGTAVTVQAMVFGNSGRRSGSGVCFTRNPATGESGLYLDFLFDAQGEDVVSGRRTPVHAERLGERMPGVLAELERGAALLERDGRDAQDIEFTVEDGRLFFLQTRAAKRSPRAALRIAVDLVHEGIIDEASALQLLSDVDLKAATVSRFAEAVTPLAEGVAASPGVASGRAAFDSESAKEMAGRGDPVVLLRREPSTEDVEGFAAAAGVLTQVGGRTAHAAVVARQLGKVCVVGCGGLIIDEAEPSARLGDQLVRPGDWIWLDGGSGAVGLGRIEVVTDQPGAELAELEGWRARVRPPVVGAQSEPTSLPQHELGHS